MNRNSGYYESWHAPCFITDMTISFDNALGPHLAALQLRSQRAELIANNLANADTPNFKARDIDFKSTLASMLPGAEQGKNLNLRTTRAGHYSAPGHLSAQGINTAHLKYQVPTMASLDGNTVDGQKEMASYAENNFQFQAAIRFVDGRFKGLMTALRGE